MTMTQTFLKYLPTFVAFFIKYLPTSSSSQISTNLCSLLHHISLLSSFFSIPSIYQSMFHPYTAWQGFVGLGLLPHASNQVVAALEWTQLSTYLMKNKADCKYSSQSLDRSYPQVTK